MEIPYEVKARPDTGLWNAKIGIWLFLASEVMLFGGLFSGYVFLRLGSGADPDYHWPEGLLNVTLGFVNTLVLIASSVFVVLAWVRLKLRDWNGFRMWMILVLLCSAAFLVIKSFEYKAKFEHFGVKLDDKTIIEGHYLADDLEYDEITQITVNLPITDYRINDIAHGEADGNLFFRLKLDGEGNNYLLKKSFVDPAEFFEKEKIRGGLFGGKGYQLTEEEAKALDEAWKVVEQNVAGSFELTKVKAKEIKASVDAYKKAQMVPLERVRKKEYTEFKKTHTGDLDEEQKQQLLSLTHPVRWYSDAGEKTLELEPSSKDGKTVKPFSIATKRSKLRKFGEDGATLYDQTVLVGKLSEEKRFLSLDVDNIDLRSTLVPEDSLIWKYMDPSVKEEFFAKRDEVTAAAKAEGEEPDIDESLRMRQKKTDGHYPNVQIPLDEVTFYSNFTPKWNTYLAVYFTLTGLHGLHVLIGALVLAYFLFFGKKMFNEDPEHLANRVEVGGLFWHFVDLVWIFLFPILYLM